MADMWTPSSYLHRWIHPSLLTWTTLSISILEDKHMIRDSTWTGIWIMANIIMRHIWRINLASNNPLINKTKLTGKDLKAIIWNQSAQTNTAIRRNQSVLINTDRRDYSLEPTNPNKLDINQAMIEFLPLWTKIKEILNILITVLLRKVEEARPWAANHPPSQTKESNSPEIETEIDPRLHNLNFANLIGTTVKATVSCTAFSRLGSIDQNSWKFNN